ncbi:MAG: (2Fe-2S)-binding protein [Roseibium sp.]|uniref:(2Fe-2S)-binding protein n=1 Tax=Roseibium sp. TaxID=1936156 RepID=UPI00262866B7|nr:(2Fe-2S)-binding protein [Roseibium sp.]MCV0427444.1 (2Fe-2S)-binding protein [Roseibium sp.]
MFTPLETASGRQVTFNFDGREFTAQEGTPLAAALLGAGVSEFRSTPVSASPRGPFCMMGACFDCLVQIDDVTVQACMTPVRDGLVVKRIPRPDVSAEPHDSAPQGSENSREALRA